MQETVIQEPAKAPFRRGAALVGADVVELGDIVPESLKRVMLPFSEVNRVLGGGMVPGSAVLLGGEPGIGKSTLLLQIASATAGPEAVVAYVAGEESPEQIKLRADRLGLHGRGLFIVPETDLTPLLNRLDGLEPKLVIVDSIQTLAADGVESSPGSLTQVRECSLQLTRWARKHRATLFLAGHVTKEGAIAGPRVMEHGVDVVLYLEGDPTSGYRILRSTKNRFGATHEVALLEMTESGLREISDPSGALLAERALGGVGSVVTPTLEGTRPLLLEVQALVNPTYSAAPRRMANGADFNRLLLVTAVLSKRLHLRLYNQDVLVNIAGGLNVEEPSADLAIALAVLSSYKDEPLDPYTLVVGEVGLSGEVRRVSRLAQRLAEGARLGFRRAIVPATAASDGRDAGLELLPVRTLREAADIAGLDVRRKPQRDDDEQDAEQ